MPSKHLTDPVERATARLLSVCVLSITGVFALGDVWLSGTTADHAPRLYGYLVLFSCYGLSRSRWYRWGAGLLCLLFPVISLREFLSAPDVQTGALIYSIFAPFVAGIFLGARASGLFTLLNLAWISSLPLVLREPVLATTLLHALAAQVIGGLIALSYGLRRDWLQQQRVERAKLHEAELMQMQKMEAIGRMAGGIAHDFNNLLTVISGGVELLARKSKAKELKLIDNATNSAQKLTAQLLTLSRQGVVEHESTDLSQVLRGVHQLLRRIIGEDVELSVTVPEIAARVVLSESQLQQILLNLATNARDAMPRGGLLEFSIIPKEDSVVLVARDNGQGMDAATARKAFEPFFTTKEVGKGTGLGLAMVFGIVNGSGGTVEVESQPGLGTEFRLTIPRVTWDEQAAPSSASPMDPRNHAKGCILLVEDDSIVRELCRSVLRREGYEVLSASDPLEGYTLFEQNAERLELVISDVVMPHMSGLEMVEQFRRVRQDLPVLFMSGYAPEEVDGRPVDARQLLTKPFRPTDLIRRVSSQVLGLGSQAPPAHDRVEDPLVDDTSGQLAHAHPSEVKLRHGWRRPRFEPSTAEDPGTRRSGVRALDPGNPETVSSELPPHAAGKKE